MTKSLRDEERTVAIAQETEVVSKGIVIDGVPVALHESADKQQQRRLRLMEIGDEHLHDMISISWRNDDLRR